LTETPVPVGPIVVVDGFSRWRSSKLLGELPDLGGDVGAEPLQGSIAISLNIAGFVDVDGKFIAHFVEKVSATIYIGCSLFFKAVLSGCLLG